MPKVNVLLPDGRVAAVDEADARELGPDALGAQPGAGAQAVLADARHDRLAVHGLLGSAVSAATGGLNALTLGGYGRAVEAVSPAAGDVMRETLKEHPAAEFTGGLGALAVPAVGELGLASQGGAAIEAATGSRALGVLGEGALLGGGAEVARAQVAGDPLTAESVLASMTVGGVLNLGTQSLGGVLTSAGKAARAKVSLAEMSEVRAQAAERLFGADAEPSPAYEDLRAAREARREAAQRSNAEARRQRSAYDDFVGSGRSFQSAERQLRKGIQEANTRFVQRAEDLPAAATSEPPTPEQRFAGEQPAAPPPNVPMQMTAQLRQQLRELGYGADEIAGMTPGQAVEASQGRTFGGTRAPQQVNLTGEEETAAELGMAQRPDFLPGVHEPTTPAEGTLADAGVPGMRRAEVPRLPADRVEVARQLGGLRKRLDAAAALRGDDPEAALNHLREVAAELNTRYQLAVPDLPAIPMAREVPVPDLLPRSLAEFAGSHADTVAAAANDLGSDAERAAVAKLAQELGLMPAAGPGGTLADAHQMLKQLRGLMDSGETATTSGGLRGRLQRLMQLATAGAAGNLAGRLVPGGGFAMGFIRRAVRGAGSAAAERMMGSEEVQLAAEVAAAREHVAGAVTRLAARLPESLEGGGRKLGPVTAWLGKRLVTGEKDAKGDLREQARRRLDEIAALGLHAPDSAYHALSPFAGTPLHLAAHQKAMGAIQALAQGTPKDPGTSPTLSGSAWRPSTAQAIETAHRIEAVMDPLSALEREVAGEGHPAAREQLRGSWPALVAQLASSISADDVVNPRASAVLTGLTGRPASPISDPIVATVLQGQYLPKQQPAQARSRGTGRPTGRPPAVQSELTGSDPGRIQAQPQE